MTFQTLSCVACLSAIAATAAPQVLTRDDAGDTLATASELHVGVNQCRFDYRLPRGMDVDVWTLTTVPGRLYRVDATALDDLAESFASLAVNESHSRTDALASLGFAGASWARGNGNPLVRTFRGLARADGWPVRYMIEVDVADDPGDPEGGDLAHAAPLSIGEWYSGAFSPPAPPSQPVTVVYSQEGYDVDAFTFPFEDRGVYRFEVEVEGSYAGLANPQWRGVATRTSPYVFFSTPASLASNDTVVECRGSGTAWFTLSGGFDDGPSRAYRVRISRIGTAPADDHGDTPERATVLNVGAAPARANLTSRVSAPTVSRTIVDLDWFSVQTVAGHAYEARVERSPIGGAAVEDVLSEDGLHHADALPNGHQVAPNTNLLASVRFHGRGDRPVKFGLLGTGNVSVAVTDLGTVADSVGDPLTGPGVLSTAQPTVSGQLEHPRDVDSFSIEPPGVPGVYRVNYTVQWAPGASPGIGPGVALTTPEGRTGVFHNTSGSVTLTRRAGGEADSFPARIDMLNKPWPSAQYPATGPVVNYTLSLQYVSPLPTPQPPPPDEAPSGFEGAPMLEVGEVRQFQRQGMADDADAVRIPLLAGRVYQVGSDAASGEIVAPDGAVVAPTLAFAFGTGRRFTVSRDGVYLQRQRYDRAIPPFGNSPMSFYAGVRPVGNATDDQPSDTPPRHLGLGTVAGTIDYSGDADQFLLPYDAGGVYRVTVHASVPFAVFDDQESFLQEGAVDRTLLVYFAPTSLPPLQKRFAVASTSQFPGQYQVTVEKLLHLHPWDDLPDERGGRAPFGLGEVAWSVFDHPFDVDVFEFGVAAGHLYNVWWQSVDGQYEATSMVQILDEAGGEVRASSVGSAVVADRDAVWHVRIPSPPFVPARVWAADEGVGQDDVGAGTGTAGHLVIGQTMTGILERPDDVDLWVVDDAGAVPPGMAARVTRSDLDCLVSVQGEYAGDCPQTVDVRREYMPIGCGFPLHYSVRVELVPFTPPVPPAPCVADVGQAGGRPGLDGRLDNNDFVAFITYFFQNNRLADLGGPGGVATPDGWLDNNDFVALVGSFFAGCP